MGRLEDVADVALDETVCTSSWAAAVEPVAELGVLLRVGVVKVKPLRLHFVTMSIIEDVNGLIGSLQT